MPDSSDYDGSRSILSLSSCKLRRIPAGAPLAKALALADAASQGACLACACDKLIKLCIDAAREMHRLGGFLKLSGCLPQEAAAIRRSPLPLRSLPIVMLHPFLYPLDLHLLCFVD